MVLFLKIEKNGNILEEEINDINKLYKTCGLRKSEGFIKLYSYNNNNCDLELWGRNIGRNNIKSVYNFPFDNINLYGTVAIVKLCKNNLDNLTLEYWNKIILEYNSKNNLNNSTVLKDESKDAAENDSEDDSDDDSNDDSDDDSEENLCNSELQPEEYIYSSEEENK